MRRLLASTFAQALEAHLPWRQRPLQADLRDEILLHAGDPLPETPLERAHAILEWTRAQFAAIEDLHAKASAFTIRVLNATEDVDREAAVLDFARQLGADAARQDSDARALRRFFDADAVLERYRRRIGERERALAYGFDRAAEAVADCLAGQLGTDANTMLGEDFAALLGTGSAWRGDARVRQAAIGAIRTVAERAGRQLRGPWVDGLVQTARRAALNVEDSCWTQLDAFAALMAISPDSIKAVLERRLRECTGEESPLSRDNDLFFRRGLAAMLAVSVGRDPRHVGWLQRLANDPDGAVRQALCQALPRMPDDVAAGMFAKLRVDSDPQVRATLMDDVPAVAGVVGSAVYQAFLQRLMAREADEFVLRMAIAATRDLTEWLVGQDPSAVPAVSAELRTTLTALRRRSDNIKVRRWAGAAREALWVLGDPEVRALAVLLRESIAGQREGQARRGRDLRALAQADRDVVGRVLAVLANEDFGFEFAPGRRPGLRRGDRFVQRLWRVIHEFRASSTDKRQAWLHTIGRRFEGPVIAPSGRMAELAPTKVPGEPLHLGEEAGWRNFVPLLDHVLSVLDRGVPFRIHSSEGVTDVVPPRGLVRRLWAFLGLSRRFAVIAALRNQPGNDYVTALRGYGLEVRYAPYADSAEDSDPQVAKLFGVGAVLPMLGLYGGNAFAYFATVFENSLFQLTIFMLLAGGWFLGRHVLRGRRMRRLREGIALVLGGWGTRGKSGTERLKAGLINAMGHPLVSKTTGCEAMFLLGRSYGDLQEMFLFRPYDKATIWEQFDLVRTARGLGARVFLWECMGLTPSYVRVLQKDWMRDDIATITNTYPDHEDVQGPAGRNIPEVMTQFIPQNSTLLTTEEEMYPILRQAAELEGTRIRPVGWKQAGLIHQNLLTRFPYAEHPFNIALVTAMADELGLGPDYAVKEMADRVVADLGVLKIYPRSVIDGRRLEFVMGMSANERFGAMGNWSRMGFAEHSLARDPGIFITTVVNNRADRVPRSRVFARILVEDVAADRHVLIGSNIDGLLGFIEESWQEYAAKITLANDEVSPQEVFAALARRQRVPLNAEELAGRLRAMLAAQADRIAPEKVQAAAGEGRLAAELTSAGVEHAEAIAAHYDDVRGQLGEYLALAEKVERAGAGADSDVREFLRKCFMAKLVPVREFYTPGEDIIRMIAGITPPGLVNRIMGMQNIKGTGLDFVYRWQAWETCHKACQQALDSDPGLARKGLDLLGSFQEYGALSDRHLRATVAALREAGGGAAGVSEAEIGALEARLEAQLAALDSANAVESGGSGSGAVRRLGETIEAIFDSTDAVVRRRAADRIYRDLIAEQISNQRAAYELKKLTTRQKGGWLGPSISSLGDALRVFVPWRGREAG